MIGVPDAYRGEAVKAFVVLKSGEEREHSEAIVDFCRERMAKYKVPSHVDIVEGLPKSAVGKVLRRELREMEEKRTKE